MEQKLKDFCKHELLVYKRFGGNKKAMIDRCYGALMFYEHCNGYDDVVGKWWDDEMLPKLNKV